jgi:hypothetical protein
MKKQAKPTKQGKKDDEKFPGYPKYPAQDDIMNQADRVGMSLDGEAEEEALDPSKVKIVRKTTGKHNESDVTKDDLQALGDTELESDEGDDELLKNRIYPVDFSGEDLDIPGSEDDDAAERIGSEDEENNSYSLGGENHEDLEEDHS